LVQATGSYERRLSGLSLARMTVAFCRLARTIADLAGAERILSPPLAEAIQYRPRSVA